MLVLMRLVHQYSVNAHVIEVLHIVNLPVKHLHRHDRCVLLDESILFSVPVLLLILDLGSYRGKLIAKLLNLTLSRLDDKAILILFLHLLKDSHLLVDLILDERHAPLLAVRDALEYALRNNDHIPVIVLYLGVEALPSTKRMILVAQ